MAKRTAKTIVRDVSTDQFQEAMASYAIADAKASQLASKMDAELAKIREKYAGDLDTFKETKEGRFETIQVYCEEHPELFKDKKSMDTAHGTVGFRTGTPKLKLVKGFTWGAVLEILKVKQPNYVRTVDEVNKEQLLIDRKEEVAKDYKGLGIMVDQDETFYISLKKEDVEQPY